MFDVVIVNWNSGSLLKDAVLSAIKYNNKLISKLIIVDNASTDRSLQALCEISEYPFDFEMLRNDSNLGFSAACNQGAKLSDSEYILFLNPDTRLFERTLEITHQFICNSKEKNIGIFGVKQIDNNGHITRSCSRFPKSSLFLCQALGIDKLAGSLGHQMKEWNHDSSRFVDQVIGAFFIVKSSLFKDLHGFDERFFVYFEEVDFCYRAKKLGWSCVYIAEAKVFHLGGGVSQNVKAKRLFYSLRSRLQYFQKHFGLKENVGISFVTFLVEPIGRIFYCASRFSIRSIIEVVHAYFYLLRWILKKMVGISE